MKKTILATLFFGVIGLSSFTKAPVNPEQIAFNYFFSDIFENDFKGVSEIEFKGKTEGSFSNLGNYKFCLKPEEKLQSMIEDVTKEPLKVFKEINHDQIKNISFTDYKEKSTTAKVYLYHALRLADNYYVFLSVQKPGEPLVRYVFELNADGENKRSCRMD